ncbi:MAG TPA: DUF2784 family protein [Stellaceae bacterium]|jgi:hypothetical protein
MAAAEAILAGHVAIILFNLFGLIAVPIGALCGWRFVRIAWWRVLHIALLAVVAVQAVAGRACILTLWQAAMSGAAAAPTPLIMDWVDRLIYWRLPIWVFGALYLAVFGYALALFWLVPPRRNRLALVVPAGHTWRREP